VTKIVRIGRFFALCPGLRGCGGSSARVWGAGAYGGDGDRAGAVVGNLDGTDSGAFLRAREPGAIVAAQRRRRAGSASGSL